MESSCTEISVGVFLDKKKNVLKSKNKVNKMVGFWEKIKVNSIKKI